MPLVATIQLSIFAFIYATTDNWIFQGNAPILDLSFVFLIFGGLVFLIWQAYKRDWPFNGPRSPPAQKQPWPSTTALQLLRLFMST